MKIKNHLAMMKLLFTKTTIVLVLMYLISSCTFTSTKTKMLSFKVENAKMTENLKTLVTCENVNVNGLEKKTNDQVSTELEIRIINGSNIPSDETKLRSLGKSIDSLFKQELSNVNDFNTFKVFFITTQSNGPVTSSSTRGFTFKSEEL
jgi:hypothetical protein